MKKNDKHLKLNSNHDNSHTAWKSYNYFKKTHSNLVTLSPSYLGAIIELKNVSFFLFCIILWGDNQLVSMPPAPLQAQPSGLICGWGVLGSWKF